jgi:hypothetical protein
MGLTKATDRMTSGSPVNVFDFGAVGDGVTDDTVAVQAAVDYAIANNSDLSVSGICLLTSSVNIDRQVDSSAADKHFTIFSLSGGGFIVKTAIAMFSSSIAFSTSPVTQLIRFKNLSFETDDPTMAAYVLDDARFLRTVFDGVSFRKIKCLYAPTVYIQSIYFLNGCQARRWQGIFFNAQGVNFDLKVHGMLMEAGHTCFDTGTVTGSSFVQNTFEGSAGHVSVILRGSQGLLWQGHYGEGNLIDLDLRIGDHTGVSHISNRYSGSTTPGGYHVYWDVAQASNSYGNYTNSRLHSVTSNSFITMNDFATTSVSNSTEPAYIVKKTPAGVTEALTVTSIKTGSTIKTGIPHNTLSTLVTFTEDGRYEIIARIQGTTTSPHAAFATILVIGTTALFTATNSTYLVLSATTNVVKATQVTGATQNISYSYTFTPLGA